MKILPIIPSETPRESYKRKAKVLDRVYKQLQMTQSLLNTNGTILDSIIEVIEEFNGLSMKE